MNMVKLACLMICMTFLVGCANPLYKPSKDLTNTVFVEYTTYVNSDPNLDSDQKRRRLILLQNYNDLLKTFDTSGNIGGAK